MRFVLAMALASACWAQAEWRETEIDGRRIRFQVVGGEAIWQASQLVVSTVIITLLFAMIFRYLPDVRIAWRDVWYGALTTAVLFVVGKFALGLYLGKKAADSSQSAAGALNVR